MDLLVLCRDERVCDLCPEEAVVELHRIPSRPRSGYLALCSTCLTIDLLERQALLRVAATRPRLQAV